MSALDGSAIARMLEECQQALDRVEPADLEAVAASGALLVDIRPVERRHRDGKLPGALVVDRNVLVCNEGSSLAARTLQQLGLPRATDLAVGYIAWSAYVATGALGWLVEAVLVW